MKNLQIVLLGNTGSGKSASGNTILRSYPGGPEHCMSGDRSIFKEDLSPDSVTKTCHSEQREFRKQRITVTDTVGLSDTGKLNIYIKTEEIFNYARDGVDVFLLVIKLTNPFSKEEQNVVTWIKNNFGENVLKYTILLFTYGDQFDKENPNQQIKEYIKKSEPLRSLADQCSGRYHVFNNRDENQEQVTELFKIIESLTNNKLQNHRYTKQDYEKAQKELLQKQCVTGAAIGGAVGGTVGAVGGTVGAVGAVGGAVGAVGGTTGAVGGAIAAKIGAVALLGATGGAVLGLAVGAGMFYFIRKYTSEKKKKK